MAIPDSVASVGLERVMHGAGVLEHSTVGARALLAVAEAVEAHGLFTPQFADSARTALAEAEIGLLLAQAETTSLGRLVVGSGDQEEDAQSILGFGNVANLSTESLRRVEQVLERAIESTRFLTAVMGYRGSRSYLLLAQNQQEIRASGGFIGAAIRATVDQGELIEIDFKDSTAVDLLPPTCLNNPVPPEPLFWYLWMGRLLFRDANWSPNFPTAASNVSDIYRLGQNVQVDGVITGTKALLVDLIALLENIQVPNVSGPLTREQAQAYTDGQVPYQCEDRHDSNRSKRCFDEDAFFAIKDRLTATISRQERAGLIKLFSDEFSKGDMLAHLFDPKEGALLWNLGWNGAIPPVDHDYLSVIDSSLPGHSAEGVQRHWKYEISLEFEQPLNSKLRLQYDKSGQFEEGRVCRQSEPSSYNCFWNYFRVYVPGNAFNVVAPPVPLHPGSERLIWGYPDSDSLSVGPSEDAGPARPTEVGGFLAIGPDTITTIPLEYQLPWGIVRHTGERAFEYHLLIQKQSGVDRTVATVSVGLPPRAELISASPEPEAKDSRWLKFEFELDTDRELVVAFHSPE